MSSGGTETETDANWTCRKCETPITDIRPKTWLAVPCGHYITHVQMVMMTYGLPSWPVTTSPAIDPAPQPRWTRRGGQRVRLFGLDFPVGVVRALMVAYPVLVLVLLALMAYEWTTGANL